MAPFVEELPVLLEEQGGAIAALSPAVCLRASMMGWEHRDPLDRLLAATAQHQTIPLITADEAFDTVPDLTRIW
jgi:PIN domain nuclease of toxin-antitoxin system